MPQRIPSKKNYDFFLPEHRNVDEQDSSLFRNPHSCLADEIKHPKAFEGTGTSRGFTDLSPRSLAERLDDMGTPVGRDAIATWLDESGIRLRQIRKDIPGGEHPDRNAQLEIIAEYIEQYESEGNPWFSIDTKAKEHLGKLYRKGRIRGSEPFKAFDHDFPSWADGVVIPHGIFDRKLNLGHINIGLSHDLMRGAATSTGLRTTVNVIRRCYETGRNATDEMKQQLRIKYDQLLPEWNYTAEPRNRQ